MNSHKKALKQADRRKKGLEGEQAAAEYLTGLGYHIILMNYRCRLGEIDIIARDGHTYVFVEVKYRKDTAYGYPQEAVTHSKQNTIRRVAEYYITQQHISQYADCRFDVVAILGNEITLVKNAF